MQTALANAVKTLVPDYTGTPTWEKSKFGDYSSPIAMQLARTLGRNPVEIANDLCSLLLEKGWNVNVTAPGFLNLTLDDVWYTNKLTNLLLPALASKPEHILVELISANPTGPLTIGAARNGALGDSVARLLENQGHSVDREYYFNDQGRQIRLFGESLVALRDGQEVPEGGYDAPYMHDLLSEIDPSGTAEELGTRGLKVLIGNIQNDVASLNVNIDAYLHESSLTATLQDALDRVSTHTYEKDGMLWLRTTDFGDDLDRVILRDAAAKSGPTYFAYDIAYLANKIARGYDRLIYVLGADHAGYVARIKAAGAILGHTKIDVLLYQLVTVSGKRQGKRLGNITTVREVVGEVGSDAVRYYLVRASHDNSLDINLDTAGAKTKDNAVYYVQYAHARICSLLARAGETDFDANNLYNWQDGERALIRHLLTWEECQTRAAETYSPHLVTEWVHSLALLYHPVNHDLPVVKADDITRAARVALAKAVLTYIAHALNTIGVSAPKSM